MDGMALRMNHSSIMSPSSAQECLDCFMASLHPTKQLLRDTAVALIDDHGPQGFTVEQLLEVSKISKGSLYHHFEDFSDVIEQAQVARFARFIDNDIQAISLLLRSAHSREEMFDRFIGIVAVASEPVRKVGRSDRATIIGLARHSEKFAALLAVEQQRLTDALTDVVRELQERGWLSRDLDPQVVATFLQAYSFGKIVDDIAETPVDSAQWTSFIDMMLRKTF
jgi:AcrR family transcriptional regulator